MILETEPRTIERSEGFIETEFKISSSAHVMRILRTGIYSKKQLCVLREFASNSQDAHAEALINERPIEITLPNNLEPTLKFRDYGNSMSHETVMNLYSTYGLSTKSASNNFIGMMGIGKFAGFAYAPPFKYLASKITPSVFTICIWTSLTRVQLLSCLRRQPKRKTVRKSALKLIHLILVRLSMRLRNYFVSGNPPP